MAAASPVARAEGVAFADLYARRSRQVYAFCLKWLRSREEAEDAVQTTFMYAWRGLDRGIVPASESAWVLAIARNVCLSATDADRRRASEVARDPHVLEDTIAAAPAQGDEVAALSAALSTLTVSQRRAIVMREWHGLSYQEISEELGLSRSAVETLLFRARRSLARKLERVPAFAPWLKSLLGGGAAKLAAGATVAVISAAAAGELATPHSHAAKRPRMPFAVAVAPGRGAAAAAARSTAVAEQRSAPARRARSQRAAASAPATALARIDAGLPAPAPSEPWTAGAPNAPSGPAAQPTPASSSPVRPTTPAGTTPSGAAASDAAPLTGTVNTAVDTATNAVDTVVGTAANAVDTANAAVGTVTNAATGAASTTAGTVQSAVSTVTTALPLLAPPPPVPKLTP